MSDYENGSFRRFGFGELVLEPTPEAQYCVVDGQDPKARPMLERIASNLVSSTEGFAREEMPRVQNENGCLRVYISVIVTTAKLSVCSFDSQLIALSTGEIANAEYKEVPFLRFRKQLASHREIPKFCEIRKLHLSARYREIAKAKESTVFIVNSESFSDFLQRFEVVAFGPEP